MRQTACALPLDENPERFMWQKGLLGVTLVFNFFDLLLTLIVVYSGAAIEANPLMARLLEAGPLAFALTKLTMVSLGVWILWQERKRWISLLGTVGVFGVYTLLMFYHLHSLAVLL